MRSSPDLKVKIPAVAGRSCAGAPWGPCSSQSGASAVDLGFCRAPRFLQAPMDKIVSIVFKPLKSSAQYSPYMSKKLWPNNDFANLQQTHQVPPVTEPLELKARLGRQLLPLAKFHPANHLTVLQVGTAQNLHNLVMCVSSNYAWKIPKDII